MVVFSGAGSFLGHTCHWGFPLRDARRRRVPAVRQGVGLDRKGMTLVEILVAIAVIAIFTAGLATLAGTLVTSGAKAKAMDTATFLAHDGLERIRNTPFANITAANFPDEGYGTIVVGNKTFPDHQRSVTIQTPAAGLSRVVVTVSWQGGSVSEELLVGVGQ